MRKLFMHNENKNNNFIQQFVSSTSPYSAILRSITYVNNICKRMYVRGYVVYVQIKV